MHHNLSIFFLFLTILAITEPMMAQNGEPPAMVHITPERLPDLNTPRGSHAAFFLNGELTVFGGHTLGFVPTATAEYLRNGEWHQLSMVYAHDNGIVVSLRSGKVLLAGGHDQPLGIGQSFMAEWYDAKTHSFEGFGCLYRKRSMATALELDSGRVIISGNQKATDEIEIFDGRKLFHKKKDVSTPHMLPLILRIAPNNAIIFSSENPNFQRNDTDIVDRVKGSPFHAPLLKEWHPLLLECNINNDAGFIGDEEKGHYEHLVVAYNDSNKIAVMAIRDTIFSLLPTTCCIPTKGINTDTILYESRVLADRRTQRAYIHGLDTLERHYIVAIDYAQRPAPITVYYTDPMPECGYGSPILSPEGNLIICGGLNFGHGDVQHDNYAPLNTAWLFRFSPDETEVEHSSWWWALLVSPLLLIFCFIIIKKRSKVTDSIEDKQPSIVVSVPIDTLMPRIRKLMESEQLFKNSELKVADVATQLCTNGRYVSDCINQQEGISFSQFVNGYRIDYAKKLLKEHPDMKIAAIAYECGFANESSFFRTFKNLTGMTPREWLNETD